MSSSLAKSFGNGFQQYDKEITELCQGLAACELMYSAYKQPKQQQGLQESSKVYRHRELHYKVNGSEGCSKGLHKQLLEVVGVGRRRRREDHWGTLKEQQHMRLEILLRNYRWYLPEQNHVF